MGKIINSMPKVQNSKKTSTNLFVRTKNSPSFYIAKAETAKSKRIRRSTWLDVLTVVLGLGILFYLMVCAIVNIYVLDNFTGI